MLRNASFLSSLFFCLNFCLILFFLLPPPPPPRSPHFPGLVSGVGKHDFSSFVSPLLYLSLIVTDSRLETSEGWGTRVTGPESRNLAPPDLVARSPVCGLVV